MQVTCKSCGAAIHSDDINLQTALAKCRYCHSVISLHEHISRPSTVGAPAAPTKRGPIARPSRFQIEELPRELVIRFRWWTPVAIFLVFFCVIWDGFLFFWYAMAMNEGAPIIMIIFPLLHVAAGAFITYMTLCMFVNSTTIRAERDGLSIAHGPLPWKGNRVLSRAEVKQLFCREHISRNKNSTTVTYELLAIDTNQQQVRLIRGLTDPHEALYLEQELEQRLGIRDEPVASELPR